VVNPGPGDRVRGDAERHRIRGGAPGLPLLATRFSNLTDYRFELVAAGASGDLAYTLGYEHISFSMDGVPVAPWTLRVTHLYRREDGEWKIVHRHADAPRAIRPLPPRRRRSKR
jgi:hypothetical protein